MDKGKGIMEEPAFKSSHDDGSVAQVFLLANSRSIPVQGKKGGTSGKNSKIQIANSKISSYYSRHYSNSAVTIQIRGTIQNIKYYSNSEYE